MEVFTSHEFGMIYQVVHPKIFSICWGTEDEGPTFYFYNTKEEFKDYLKLKYLSTGYKITFDDDSKWVCFRDSYSKVNFELYSTDVYKFLKENLA